MDDDKHKQNENASTDSPSKDSESGEALSLEPTEHAGGAYERYDSSDPWTQSPQISKSEYHSRKQSSQADKPNMSHDSRPKEADDLGLSKEHWERDIVNRLAFATLNEQRRARRWNIFFKFLIFIYIAAVLFYIPSDWDRKAMPGGKHTAIIEIQGVIADDAEASADNIVSALRSAFKHKNTAAIILRINSPGGSPVQAGYVYDEIKRLRAKHEDKKVYAVITDICASGGYYIAAAADEIYADKASIVGSIGVLMNGFGFVESMKKLGIERRLMTAGEHKGMLDPFSPLDKTEAKHAQSMLDTIHNQFISTVKAGRGERLKDDPKLFSGMFWSGETSLMLGLVDGLGSSSYVAREIIGAENLVDFTPRRNYLDRFAERFGATFANVLATSMGLNNLQLQ